MEDDNVPVLTVEQKVLLQKLKIWDKIASGNLHSIALPDVQALFDILDPGEKGHITRGECYSLLQIQNVKISRSYLKDLCEDADKDNSGTITAEEFLKALVTGKVAFNYLKESLNKGAKEMKQNECDRSDLLEWLQEEYETSSALYSMPAVLILCIAYVYFATTHVDITNAWRMKNTFYNNLDTLWKPPVMGNRYGTKAHMEWTLNTWLPLYYRQNLNTNPQPGRVAVQNQIIGGSRLHKEFYYTGACNVGQVQAQIYNSYTGQCDRSGGLTEEDIVLPYHLLKSIHETTIDNLTQTNWFDNRVAILEYQTIFYNGHNNMLTFERIHWDFQKSGYLNLKFNYESWMAEPYSAWFNIIPDLLFILVLLRMAHQEAKELLPAIAGGMDGIKDYFKFWNLVDWTAIVVGFINVAIWFYFFYKVSVELPAVVEAIPQAELDARVLQNSTYLTVDILAEIIDPILLNTRINEVFILAREIYDFHAVLRGFFFGYFFILIMKFFKTFQANPRLDIVVQTINHCSVNVVHFAIVFLAIFLCYAFAGHFLLGHKNKGWDSMLGSLFMLWSTELSMADVFDFSVPVQAVCYFWSFSYQILVQQVMLNMLYCIVFDSYAFVKTRAGAPLTLYAQIRDAAATARETRGFVNLYTLIVQLEDDDFPAHPNEVVTARSLKRAFERDGMTRANAEYLLMKTADFVQEKSEEIELSLSDAIRVTGHIQTTMLKSLDVAEDSLSMISTEARNKEAAERQQDRAAFVSNALGEMPSFEPQQGKEVIQVNEDCLEKLELCLDRVGDVLTTCRQQQTDVAADIDQELKSIWQEEDQRYNKVDAMIHEMEKGLQAMERSIGSIGVSFSGTNFQQLASVPERCETAQLLEALDSQAEKGCVTRLDNKLQELGIMMNQLSDKAESTSELREIVWKLELSLRKLNNGKSVIPMKCFIREEQEKKVLSKDEREPSKDED